MLILFCINRLLMTVYVQMVKVIRCVECVSVTMDSLVQSVNAQTGERVCKFIHIPPIHLLSNDSVQVTVRYLYRFLKN